MKYKRFLNMNEAHYWGKKHYGEWLRRYQIDGKLRGCFESEHPEHCLNGDFSKNELEKLQKEAKYT